MKAIAEPKLGAWDLGELVKDPNGPEFKEFLETIKKNVTEFENRKNLLNNEISVSDFKNLLHFIENVLRRSASRVDTLNLGTLLILPQMRLHH